MRTTVLIIALTFAVGWAWYAGPRLARFNAEDICLDDGGRVLHATRQCELWGNQIVPLRDNPGNVFSWSVIALVSGLPGVLAIWAAHRTTRPSGPATEDGSARLPDRVA